jgi:acetylcholinesterase
VASQLGCANLSAEAELGCMKNVSAYDIENFLQYWGDGSKSPSLSFNPTIDNRTKFDNYTARALAGNYTKVPAIIGTNANEGVSLISYNPAGVNMSFANTTTLGLFLCAADQTTTNRYNSGSITYRYLYAGNFSNIAPRSWEGAYHSSELPLIFGTSQIVRGADTAFETELSQTMQDFWLAFAQDPMNGLPKVGWPQYRPGGEAVEFGSGDSVLVRTISVDILEEPCDGVNPKPGGMPPS